MSQTKLSRLELRVVWQRPGGYMSLRSEPNGGGSCSWAHVPHCPTHRSYMPVTVSPVCDCIRTLTLDVLPGNPTTGYDCVNVKKTCTSVFTALHGMQTRSSDGNSVCPSVRQTRGL